MVTVIREVMDKFLVQLLEMLNLGTRSSELDFLVIKKFRPEALIEIYLTLAWNTSK